MTLSETSQRTLDAYLATLHKLLRGMPDDDIREIVEEIRSHVMDKASASGIITDAGVTSALSALGSPEELAGQYMTDDLLARAQATGSFWLILRSLFRWASISVAGFFVLIGSLICYCLGFFLAWAAILKPLHPQRAGLWMIPRPGGDVEMSLHLGFASPPATGHEVLGWWIIPIGILGIGLFFATLRVDQWSLGKFRRSLSLGGRS